MRHVQWACWAVLGLGYACATGAFGQTTETPYQRSLKQQELHDLQQQNARAQQQLQQQQQDQQWQQATQQSQAQQNAAQAQGRAVLQSWQQRPALAPQRNPLLGRWNSLGNGTAGKTAANGDIAALAQSLIGGLTAGMCDSMLGSGVIEFRPTTMVAIGPDGREHLKYHVEYRGGDSRVVVLPRDVTSFTHMIIDFSGSDRASVAAVGCRLARAGTAAAQAIAPALNAAPPAQWEQLGHSVANGGMVMYVDRSTIRKSGHMAQMSDMWDFKSARTFEGKPFLSVRNQYEYDCALTRRRMLFTRGFSQHMGQGSMVASDDVVLKWDEIAPTEMAMEYWKAACAKS